MYIVTRSFRGPSGPLLAGSIVEPASIRDFRYRLQQKHIVEVTEHNFEQYQTFFKDRHGIEMPALNEVHEDQTNAEAEAKAKEEAEAKAKEEAEAKAKEETKQPEVAAPVKAAKAVAKTTN